MVRRSQAEHWICGIQSCVWRCRQPQGKPGRTPLVQRLQIKAKHWICGIRSRVWQCCWSQGKPGRNFHLWQRALTNENQHWIRGIRSRVWRCRQPQGKPGRNAHLWQGALTNETQHWIAAFDPASGDVVSRRGNQVKICPSFTGGAHK